MGCQQVHTPAEHQGLGSTRPRAPFHAASIFYYVNTQPTHTHTRTHTHSRIYVWYVWYVCMRLPPWGRPKNAILKNSKNSGGGDDSEPAGRTRLQPPRFLHLPSGQEPILWDKPFRAFFFEPEKRGPLSPYKTAVPCREATRLLGRRPQFPRRGSRACRGTSGSTLRDHRCVPLLPKLLPLLLLHSHFSSHPMEQTLREPPSGSLPPGSPQPILPRASIRQPPSGHVLACRA